jgi:hypothetical protein
MQPEPQRSRELAAAVSEEELIDKLIPLLEALIEKSYLSGTTYRGLHVPLLFLSHPRMFLTIFRGQRKIANLLQIPFWSQTAYSLGGKVVQYHLRRARLRVYPAISRFRHQRNGVSVREPSPQDPLFLGGEP